MGDNPEHDIKGARDSLVRKLASLAARAENTDDVAALIEDGIEDADVQVGKTRHEEDEDHLAAVVVSPAFEGESLVDQHEMVYDALGDHMTEGIHALELKTYTPEEYAERKE